MKLQKRLLIACMEINKLGGSQAIDISQTFESITSDFIDAVEWIDDEERIDDLSESVLDLYEELIDEDDEEIIFPELYNKTVPIKEKEFHRLLGYVTPEEKREQIIPKKLPRKLDI